MSLLLCCTCGRLQTSRKTSRPSCHHSTNPPPPQNDLSNRLRPDAGIRTEAVLLADDDELLR